MKILIINGSPKMGGNSSLLIDEITKQFDKIGVTSEVISIGNKDVRDCIACGYCYEHEGCVFINAIKDAKEKYPDLLDEEERVWTHFIKNN